MVDVSAALGVAQRHFPYQAGAFYGAVAGRSLGIGLIYSGVRYPLFDRNKRLFDTVEGFVYILTHECDIDQNNRRHFNDYVLLCPIILFEEFAGEFCSAFSEEEFLKFLPDVASDRIFRVFYFPPHHVDGLQCGGLIYLNQISNTHVNEFNVDGAVPVCALSEYAQGIVDRKLQNHLFRPKDENLPRLT